MDSLFRYPKQTGHATQIGPSGKGRRRFLETLPYLPDSRRGRAPGEALAEALSPAPAR